MKFNEDNTIEQKLIAIALQQGWEYVPAADVPRQKDDVLVSDWLMDALMRLNGISIDQAEQIIYKLRTVVFSGNSKESLIEANDKFRKMLFEENSYPFGIDGDNINIRFFSDKEKENQLVVTNQWEYPRESIHGGKRLDLVFLINGIPVMIGEAKTLVRPQVTWADGAVDMLAYQKSIPEMFVPNIINFATDGREFYTGGVGLPAAKWGPWFADESRQHGDLLAVEHNASHLLQADRLIDIYRFYSVFTGNTKGEKIKVVCRYQQYLGGEAIVHRVIDTFTKGIGPKQGLIWHFQGSGKSWLMVFAAQKLRLSLIHI